MKSVFAERIVQFKWSSFTQKKNLTGGFPVLGNKTTWKLSDHSVGYSDTYLFLYKWDDPASFCLFSFFSKNKFSRKKCNQDSNSNCWSRPLTTWPKIEPTLSLFVHTACAAYNRKQRQIGNIIFCEKSFERTFSREDNFTMHSLFEMPKYAKYQLWRCILPAAKQSNWFKLVFDLDKLRDEHSVAGPSKQTTLNMYASFT